MNIKVKDYLEDLSNVDAPRENGVILLDETFVKDNDLFGVFLKDNIHYTYLKDKPYYFKTINSTRNNNNICTNTEIINSQVYNDLGVNCADYYPMIFKSAKNGAQIDSVGVICQDLNSLEVIEVCQATQSSMYYDHILMKIIADKINDGYWSFLQLKDILVGRYMTEECFNEIVNMFLLDVISTQKDRNPSNFFLCRKKGSQLWEGIITIDNAYTLQNECLSFIKESDSSSTQLAEHISQDKCGLMLTFPRTYNMQPYNNRLIEINNLIQNGSFNCSQIGLLRKVKNYDLSSTIDGVEKEKHIQVSTTQKDLMNFMWEKVQYTLEV